MECPNMDCRAKGRLNMFLSYFFSVFFETRRAIGLSQQLTKRHCHALPLSFTSPARLVSSLVERNNKYFYFHLESSPIESVKTLPYLFMLYGRIASRHQSNSSSDFGQIAESQSHYQPKLNTYQKKKQLNDFQFVLNCSIACWISLWKLSYHTREYDISEQLMWVQPFTPRAMRIY